LPPFNEEKDDLDAYLTRFETVCIAFEVKTRTIIQSVSKVTAGKIHHLATN